MREKTEIRQLVEEMQEPRKLGISYVYMYRRIKKVAPEKIRHRISKREIIENVFDCDEKLYATSRLIERKKHKYANSVKEGRS